MVSQRRFSDGSSEIIGAAIRVHQCLGPGLLESTYEKCLAHKLAKSNIAVRRQVPLSLRFEDLLIPEAYRIDLIVADSIVVEVKACDQLSAVHFAQVLTYLRLTSLKVGIILNFNSVHLKDGIHRVVNSY
jgi:GxxExxY protein